MDEIILWKGETGKTYKLQWTVCSSSTANDGYLPNGTTLASHQSTKVYDKDGTDKSSEIVVGTPSLSTLTVTFVLKYPATTGDGRYFLKQVVRDASGYDWVYYFHNITAKSRQTV